MFTSSTRSSNLIGILCITGAIDYGRGLLPWIFRPPVPLRESGIDIFTQDNKNILVINGSYSQSTSVPVPSTSSSPSGLYFFELLANNTVRPLAHMNVYWRANTSTAEAWEFQALSTQNIWDAQVSVRWPYAAMEWRSNSSDRRVTVYNIAERTDASLIKGIPATICAGAGNANASGIWMRNSEELWVLDFINFRIYVYENSSLVPLVAKQ